MCAKLYQLLVCGTLAAVARKPKASSKYASRLPQKVNAKAQPGAPLKAHRVQTIVTLMTSGLWEPGITTQELAKKWNVDASTVRHDAANARAVLMQNDEDTELIRFQIKALLHKTIVIATDASDESMPPRDRCKALTDTAIATARIFGIEAPKKIDIKTQLSDVEARVLADPDGAAFFWENNRIPSDGELAEYRKRKAEQVSN